jgi:hypothetical protein
MARSTRSIVSTDVQEDVEMGRVIQGNFGAAEPTQAEQSFQRLREIAERARAAMNQVTGVARIEILDPTVLDELVTAYNGLYAEGGRLLTTLQASTGPEGVADLLAWGRQVDDYEASVQAFVDRASSVSSAAEEIRREAYPETVVATGRSSRADWKAWGLGLAAISVLGFGAWWVWGRGRPSRGLPAGSGVSGAPGGRRRRRKRSRAGSGRRGGRLAGLPAGTAA